MKLYDCFTFSGELDVLEVRLKELYPLVDWFVIVEANRTHSGKSKDFVLEKNLGRYKDYADKMRYIQVEDMPAPAFNWIYSKLSTSRFSAVKSMSYSLKIGGWRPENHQRNAICRGLDDAKDEDIIMVSDLDEIPSKDSIKKIKNNDFSKNERVSVLMNLFQFYYNLLMTENWEGTKAVKFDLLRKKLFKRPQMIRTSFTEKFFVNILRREFLKTRSIYNGGWHFSWIGDEAKIREKMRRSPHREFRRFSLKEFSKIYPNQKVLKINTYNFPKSLLNLAKTKKIKPFLLKGKAISEN